MDQGEEVVLHLGQPLCETPMYKHTDRLLVLDGYVAKRKHKFQKSKRLFYWELMEKSLHCHFMLGQER